MAMKQTIQIKEFDLLTCNKEYERNEDTQLQYIDEDSFQLLEELILKFQANEEADAIDFFSISVRRNVGRVIRAKNYVGIIQLKNGTTLEILPKIHGVSNQNDTKKIFLKMIKSLKEVPSKTFNEAQLQTEKMDIFEIFIRLFIKEIQLLVKKGIKSAYYEVENNLNVYKGKMLFSQHIKHNIVHKERFFVAHDEFGLNRAENRLIKSTLLKLLKASTDFENRKEIRQLLLNFEFVEPSPNISKDFASVKIDRNTTYYERAIQWSKIFLMNKSFTTFAGDSFGKAILFPMDKVFEAYIGENIKKIFSNEQWGVKLQDRKYYLFERKFNLRPDIVLNNNQINRTIIMDTKWKVLKNNPKMNYGISQMDMYQMYAYAKKYGTDEIWLIYPKNDEFEDFDELSFKSDDGVMVNIFFVDCADVERSLNELKNKVF